MFWTFEYEHKSVHEAEILIKGTIDMALIKMMIITIIEELLYDRHSSKCFNMHEIIYYIFLLT